MRVFFFDFSGLHLSKLFYLLFLLNYARLVSSAIFVPFTSQQVFSMSHLSAFQHFYIVASSWSRKVWVFLPKPLSFEWWKVEKGGIFSSGFVESLILYVHHWVLAWKLLIAPADCFLKLLKKPTLVSIPYDKNLKWAYTEHTWICVKILRLWCHFFIANVLLSSSN